MWYFHPLQIPQSSTKPVTNDKLNFLRKKNWRKKKCLYLSWHSRSMKVSIPYILCWKINSGLENRPSVYFSQGYSILSLQAYTPHTADHNPMKSGAVGNLAIYNLRGESPHLTVVHNGSRVAGYHSKNILGIKSQVLKGISLNNDLHYQSYITISLGNELMSNRQEAIIS